MSFPDDLRQEASEQRELANDLIGNHPLIRTKVDGDGLESTDATNLVSVIVGHVNATMMETIADLTDFLSTGNVAGLNPQRQAAIDRNDAIRKAAARAHATGDWNEFDKLTNRFAEPDDGDASRDGSS